MNKSPESPGGDEEKKPEKPKESPIPLSASLDSIANDLQAFHPSNLLESESNPRTKQFFYELFSSAGGIPKAADDKRPEWAMNAWKEFWRSLQAMPEKVEADSDAVQVGYSVGVLSEIGPVAPKTSPALSGLFDIFSNIIPQIRAMAAQSSPAEAADFFNAQKEGQKQLERVLQPTQRAKIFLAFAVAWEVITEFKSTNDLYLWLISEGIIQPPGSESGKGGTDSREIRKICQIMKFGSLQFR